MSVSTPPTLDRSSYECLLRHYRPTPIRSERENRAAVFAVQELSRREVLTPAEEDLMELLTQLIERFESHYTIPNHGVRPLEFLLELARVNGLTQVDFVDVLGSADIVAEVFNDKREI